MEGIHTGSDLVLRKHAKSFYFASRFLPQALRGPVANLYAFCRYVDDVSDFGEPDEAGARLRTLRAEIEAGKVPEVLQFESLGIRRQWILDLVDGAISDTEFKPFQNEEELDLYCYRVAGVVGLMMCPLLGVHDQKAWQNAVDLGSAMQLTNMARDVAEDADRGRVYFPLDWLEREHLAVHEVSKGQNARQLVRRMLVKAEGLYRSGEIGLRAIPWAQRAAIGVALTVYRGIGRVLAQQSYDPFKGRAYVSLPQKFILALYGLWISYNPWGQTDPKLNSHNLTWLNSVGTRHGLRMTPVESVPFVQIDKTTF